MRISDTIIINRNLVYIIYISYIISIIHLSTRIQRDNAMILGTDRQPVERFRFDIENCGCLYRTCNDLYAVVFNVSPKD